MILKHLLSRRTLLLVTCIATSNSRTESRLSAAARRMSDICHYITHPVASYHDSVMAAARAQCASTQLAVAASSPVSQECQQLAAQLATRKQELHAMWKTQWTFGCTITPWAAYAGRISLTRVFAGTLNVCGSGLMRNCFAWREATVHGDTIATSCQFKQGVRLVNSAKIFSLENSLVRGTLAGDVQPGSVPVIIELRNTVVEGDIVFTAPGVILLDETSKITGRIIQGTIVRTA